LEGHHVYVSSYKGVHVSRNGEPWKQVADDLDGIRSINAIAFSPDGRMLFAGENRGLYGLQLR